MKPDLARSLKALDQDYVSTPNLVIPKSYAGREVNLICGANIKPRPIDWMWPEWVPLGKLTILAGAAGTGKTTLALSIASTLSNKGIWPDGTQSNHVGNILIWSSEDVPDDTLVPRLIAANADLGKVHFIDGITDSNEKMSFDPSIDIPILKNAIAKFGGISLLIIDPIVSAVAGDMHRANDVRRSLQAIVDFAEEQNCAVLGITHFAKGGSGTSPQERVIGSQAFGALARMVLVTAKEETSDRRVLARAKSNITIDTGGIAYSLESKIIPDGIEATFVDWKEKIEGTAREILGEVEQDYSDDGSAKEDAEQFLRDLLSDGALNTKQVKADADGAGYSWATIRRAQKSIGVMAVKGGMKEGWKWQLP